MALPFIALHFIALFQHYFTFHCFISAYLYLLLLCSIQAFLIPVFVHFLPRLLYFTMALSTLPCLIVLPLIYQRGFAVYCLLQALRNFYCFIRYCITNYCFVSALLNQSLLFFSIALPVIALLQHCFTNYCFVSALLYPFLSQVVKKHMSRWAFLFAVKYVIHIASLFLDAKHLYI